MRLSDLWRYMLWIGVAVTAYANHRHYRMQTTWLPHLLTNTVSLLLPDVARLLLPNGRKSDNVIPTVLDEVVRDNPQYAVYVTPLAIGYILSNPRYNIYKGEWGKKRLAGFGFDALPHAATAFALTALTYDTAQMADKIGDTKSPLAVLLHWADKHPTLFSALVLILVTVNWELSEYYVHQYEMAVAGDAEKINMQWSAEDTARDSISNSLGWLLAVLWRGSTNKD